MKTNAMQWHVKNRNSPECRAIADRHYSRQTIGAPGFVPPGRCIVLYQQNALWVTSWPFSAYVRHAWPGAWINSCFRNEGARLSSKLIREAVAATRWIWPDVPDIGMVTFVDASKVRKKRDPGRCYIRAGFRRIGCTKGGLHALGITADDMPKAEQPLGTTGSLFAAGDQ